MIDRLLDSIICLRPTNHQRDTFAHCFGMNWNSHLACEKTVMGLATPPKFPWNKIRNFWLYFYCLCSAIWVKRPTLAYVELETHFTILPVS